MFIHLMSLRLAKDRRTRGWSGIASALALFLALGALTSAAASAGGEISVQGTTILRDGAPWVAKGVTLVGLVAPPALSRGNYAQARQQFGEDELKDVKSFGADLIRFQVSQGGSDPQSTIYSADYLKEVQSAVELARRDGFSVIVSLQAEEPSGLNEMGMPNEKAQRAWQSLAPLFAADRGVMLELFNEPSPNGPDAAPSHDWATWRAAMQPLVDKVRGTGAKNVLVVDGLFWSQVLKGAPQIQDPLAQIIYAVHPYYSKYLRNKSDWDDMFGDFSKTHAVMATEWSAVSFRQNCNSETPQFAADMLKFLRERRIGLVVWAFDFPRGIFVSVHGPLTTFNGFQCGPATQFGAGSLIAQYFK
jgi:sugar phosphate isomerase/epimerase